MSIKSIFGISDPVKPTTAIQPQQSGTDITNTNGGGYTSLISTSSSGLARKAEAPKRTLLGGA